MTDRMQRHARVGLWFHLWALLYISHGSRAATRPCTGARTHSSLRSVHSLAGAHGPSCAPSTRAEKGEPSAPLMHPALAHAPALTHRCALYTAWQKPMAPLMHPALGLVRWVHGPTHALSTCTEAEYSTSHPEHSLAGAQGPSYAPSTRAG